MPTSTPHRGRWKVLAIAAAVVLPVAFLVAVPLLNTWKFQQLAASFGALKHPAGTLRVKSARDFGNLSGTGNQCGYFVGELRTYVGQKKSIQAFYARQKVWDTVSSSSQAVPIVFAEGNLDAAHEAGIVHLDDLNRWGLIASVPGQKSYVVFFLNGHGAGCDLRCH
jgi:hypothetical protein